jgi:hypothetical protein
MVWGEFGERDEQWDIPTCGGAVCEANLGEMRLHRYYLSGESRDRPPRMLLGMKAAQETNYHHERNSDLVALVRGNKI